MTVSELIKALREFDGDLEVKYHYDSAPRGPVDAIIKLAEDKSQLILISKEDVDDYHCTPLVMIKTES